MTNLWPIAIQYDCKQTIRDETRLSPQLQRRKIIQKLTSIVYYKDKSTNLIILFTSY